MEENKWYSFANEAAFDTFSEEASVNRKIADFLGFKPFLVLTENDGIVSSIGYKNDDGSVNVVRARDMNLGSYSGITIIGSDEYHYFEVEETPEDVQRAETPEDSYLCLASSGVEPKWTIIFNSSREACEEHMKQWLYSNPLDVVLIVKSVSRNTAKQELVIKSEPF